MWRDIVKIAHTKRSALHGSLWYLQQTIVGRLFRAWHDAAMRSAALYIIASKFMKRLQLVTLSRALAAWVKLASQQRGIRLAALHDINLPI